MLPDARRGWVKHAVRAAVDVRACGEGSDRIWRRSTTDERDLAVFLLVDTSRSTESACGRRTVIEIAREAVIALTEGVAACGDDIAVASFSSLRRDRVYVRIVKDFDEPVDDGVRARIAGLKPGFYTRIGPALRHATNGLSARPNRKRLLIVLTDGKPNDLDHYQGRYGIEDTRRAVMEARRKGLAVFGITVDAKARSYFPYIFGAGGYAIVSRPEKLAEANVPLRPVKVLFISPSQPIERIAARFVHEMPPMVRFVLRPTGAMNRSGSNLASYLLFEAPFCRTLIDLGYQDTISREPEVKAFFDDSSL